MERRKNRVRTNLETTKDLLRQGDLVPALCEYLRTFEKSAKKIRDAKEKQCLDREME